MPRAIWIDFICISDMSSFSHTENSFRSESSTYVNVGLGAAHVWGGDVELAGELPGVRGLLDLASNGGVDSPAIVVNDLSLGLKGLLVVGEGHGGGAVTVTVLQLADSLLNLLSLGRGAFSTSGLLVFNLSLESEILHSNKGVL